MLPLPTCLHSHVALCLGSLTWVALFGVAHAYCPARSCDPDGDMNCAVDEDGCSMEGVALARPAGCIYVAVQEGGARASLKLSDAEFLDAVLEAFEAWTSVDCGDGARPSIIVQPAGPRGHGIAAVEEPFACGTDADMNVDVWLVTQGLNGQTFVSLSSGATAGTTNPKYRESSGEVFDADVALNGLWFLLLDQEAIRDSLRVVATHEAGHALGLAHSQRESAMMFRNYEVTPDRMLTQDDIDGICALHPPMSIECPGPPELLPAIDAAACEEAQRAMETPPSEDTPWEGGGACSLAGPHDSRGPRSHWWWFGGALVLCARARRRPRV